MRKDIWQAVVLYHKVILLFYAGLSPEQIREQSEKRGSDDTYP